MIDKKRIEEEAQHFFEWPDPKHRDTVTLTSCVIFAATIAEMVNEENIGRGEKLADELRAEVNRLRAAMKAIRDHWREFGPEHGFDETLETACRVLEVQRWR